TPCSHCAPLTGLSGDSGTPGRRPEPLRFSLGSADTPSMIVHARTRWAVTSMCLLLGASALVLTSLRTPGLVLAALAAVPILVVQRMRISADASGVTVVNLLRARRLEWSEISDFQMGHVALSTCLDVC